MHQLALEIGAIPQNSVTDKTNFLVVGKQATCLAHSSKELKAMAMREKGFDINILSTSEFYAFFNEED